MASGSLFGVRYRVTGPAPQVQLDALLPPSPTRAEDGSPAVTLELTEGVVIVEGERRCTLSTDPAAAAQQLSSEIELQCAARAPAVVVVHAGSVSVGGRALLLPGRSLAGKSTLTSALVDQGAGYLSDEYALLTPAGRVLPYPRSIRLRQEQTAVRRLLPTEPTPVAADGMTMGGVADLRWSPESGWSVTELSRGEAVLALLANAVAAQLAPERCLQATSAAVASSWALRGTRGAASEAAGHLLAAMS